MKSITLRHPIDCSADTFWERIHFGGFNDVMFNEFLGYGYVVLADDRDAGTRKTRVTPKVDVPAVLLKAVGDKISFEEHGSLKRAGDKPERYEFNVIPSASPNKIKIRGHLSIEPVSDTRCYRVVHFDIECGIFGVGGIFEHFVAAEISKNYDESAKFTNRFLLRA